VRILVADDDSFFLQVITDALNGAGHEVIPAQSGTEALEKIVGEQPEMVILDVLMPGMAGTEVSEKLRDYSRTAPIPIMLVSSFAKGSGPASAADYFADDFMEKPVDTDELIKRVEQLAKGDSKFAKLGEGRPPRPAPGRTADKDQLDAALDDIPDQIETGITLEEAGGEDVVFDDEDPD
jgi:CheY-like chemotaxis protein